MNTPNQYDRCLAKLESDYKDRGIVDLLHCTDKTREKFEAALRANRHPISWDQILRELKANNWSLLRLAATMPGDGTKVELIGADEVRGVAIRSSLNLQGDLHTIRGIGHVKRERSKGGWDKVIPEWHTIRLLTPDEGHTRKGAATPLQLASLVQAERWSLASPVKRKGEYVDKYDANCGLIAAFEAVTQRPYSRNPDETYGYTLVVSEDEYQEDPNKFFRLTTEDFKRPESTYIASCDSNNPDQYLRAAPWVTSRNFKSY